MEVMVIKISTEQSCPKLIQMKHKEKQRYSHKQVIC